MVLSAGVQLGAMLGAEVLKAIIQAYTLAARQQGLTEEQAKANFTKTFDVFWAVSEKPIEPVKP